MAQAVHVVEAAAAAKRPATQSAHELLPRVGVALPTGQLPQAARAPGAEANVPREHGEQVVLQRHVLSLVQGVVLLLSTLKKRRPDQN